MSEGQLLVAIVGPTASGKSALALEAGGLLGGEIINCDALQMYRSLQIGTGKPSVGDLKTITHHMYGFLSPNEYYSAGRYMAEAREVCDLVRNRGKIPFVVGGTGLYLRALLNGIFKGPGRSDILRGRLDRIRDLYGPQRFHRLLESKDFQAAQRISVGDRKRVLRALEVYFLTGSPLSRLQRRQSPLVGYRILKVGLKLSRSLLYDRINFRVRKMFQTGLLNEVNLLLEKGYDEGCKAFEALGYRYAVKTLRGELSLEEAIGLTSRDTRRYAKRQLTWFGKDQEIQWIQSPGETMEALQELLKLTRCNTSR